MITAASTVAAALALLLLDLPAAVAVAAEPPGAETPEALVARMQAAAENQDVPEMMACVAHTSRRVAVRLVGMRAGSTSLSADSEAPA